MRRVLVVCALLVCVVATQPARPLAQRGPTISSDLTLAGAKSDRVRVIVQADDKALSTVRGRLRGLLRRELAGAVVLDVTRDELDRLSRDSSIAHISGDIPVSAHTALTNQITAATDVWKGEEGLLGLLGTPGYDGSGVVVAVLDSGIAPHKALGNRVIARVNMVSWEADAPGDAYGHGTHIAGAVTGSGSVASKVAPSYGGGSAPGAKLVDVRVLGRGGMGLTSDVIAGIDWAIANRAKYGIRVLTMALGHPVTEPSTTDPLCRAVARAVASGLVVVASAGNYGQTAEGAPIMGGITSPGNSPFAITVGAIDAGGTTKRSDDRVAAFSSRGPTRFEFIAKPDIVAPGTRLVSLEAKDSYLSSTYPQWHVGGGGTNAYMRLSGTSMATGVVAGGVALLLQANPGLTPEQVKIALQMGATYMPDAGLVGAGAGSVHFGNSMKVASAALLTSLTSTVSSVLGTGAGAAYMDRGTLIDRIYDRTDIRLLGLLDLNLLFLQGAEPGVLNLLGLNNPLANTPANWLVWGEVAGWTSSYYLVWGTAAQSPSGQYLVWGTTDYTGSSYLVWGTSVAGQEP